jgi:tetratricopeptide (TPR) repeat protein
MKRIILRLAIMVVILTSCQFANAELNTLGSNYFEEGNKYVEIGQNENAIAFYLKALMIEPNNARIHYNLGVAYGNCGNLEKEIIQYRKVLEINPKHINALYNLGIAYGNIGEWKMAFNVFKRLVKLQPKDSDAHYSLALIGFILKDKQVVEAEYMILGKIAPDLAVKIEDLISKASLYIA